MTNDNYNKDKFIKEFVADLAMGMQHFYTSKSLRRIGKTKDTKEYYSEIISKFLTENKFIQNGELAGVKQKTREKSYYTKSHETPTINNSNPVRFEENFVKTLFIDDSHNSFNTKFGLPIDYQTPLCDKRGDKLGKVDLLTYKEDTGELFMVEVKRKLDKDKGATSDETLLRCCLEIQTYYQIIDKEKLIKDFYAVGKIHSENPKVRKAVLIFEGTNPYKEYADLGNRPYLKQLVNDLDIEIWDFENTWNCASY